MGFKRKGVALGEGLSEWLGLPAGTLGEGSPYILSIETIFSTVGRSRARTCGRRNSEDYDAIQICFEKWRSFPKYPNGHTSRVAIDKDSKDNSQDRYRSIVAGGFVRGFLLSRYR